MPDIAATPPAAPPRPTHADLFVAFLWITLSSFGAPLPWTRRMFVEQKRWTTTEEFNEIYALCQFLPGPNIVNLAAVFGSRMRGATGAAGLLLATFAKMATPLFRSFGPAPFVVLVTAGAIGVMRWPLPWVMVVLVPLSVALAWWGRR